MAFSLKTHIAKKGRNGEAALARLNPYLRLRNGQESPIFVQGGSFFFENGQRIKDADLPDWVDAELEKVLPEVRREVGLK